MRVSKTQPSQGRYYLSSEMWVRNTESKHDLATPYLLYNPEAISVIAVEDIRPHEGKYRHDIV